ncbi:MAG: hypothetical protein QXF76_05020 [Candidatus Anstonellales archaeon]
MKKLALNLSIIFLNFLTSLSCSFISENDDYIYYQWASVQKVEILSNQNGKLDLKIKLTIPTPCNEYHTKEVSTNGDTIFVRYFSKIKKETICIQILGSMEIYDSFNLQSGKIYLFKFFKDTNSTLDTLIKIN